MPSGAVRARKITNAGNRKVIGKFPSLKMNAVIWWESQLERDYIYLLEIDPEVLSYGEQPLTISYTDKRYLRNINRAWDNSDKCKKSIARTECYGCNFRSHRK
ncbi:hypothetical protein [Lyngbya aestuarii]|uniref:hypothetical protein n=1 Tax=Lyngbya aestuarii TaxID=118322 RepID=UPI00403DCA8D